VRTLVLLLVAALCPTPALAQVGAPDLPPGDAAWILRISTSGGITGAGLGNYVVTSSGDVTCSRIETCATALAPAQVRELTDLIVLAAAATWVVRPAMCSDCFRIRVELRRRERDGIRVYLAEWDEPVAFTPEITRLYRAVANLRPVR
jgi:hypothetical protein